MSLKSKSMLMLFFLPFSVLAEPASFYVGSKVGINYFQDACAEGSTDCDNRAMGYGIFGGYDITPWLAIETGLNDYGDIAAQSNMGRASASIWGGDVSARFNYNVNTNTQLFAKVGAAYLNINDNTFTDKQTSRGVDIASSIGIQYAFSPTWSLRAEYQFIDGIGDRDTQYADLHATSLGVSYRWPQASTESAPVPPPPVEIAHQTTTDTVYLGSALLFEPGNASTLTSNQQLQDIIKKIHASQNETSVIRIVGYADDTGSASFNKTLSEQRAEAVARFFAGQGIDVSRIQTLGRGELSPVADNRTVAGRAMNRRVEVYFMASNSKSFKVNK